VSVVGIIIYSFLLARDKILHKRGCSDSHFCVKGFGKMSSFSCPKLHLLYFTYYIYMLDFLSHFWREGYLTGQCVLVRIALRNGIPR